MRSEDPYLSAFRARLLRQFDFVIVLLRVRSIEIQVKTESAHVYSGKVADFELQHVLVPCGGLSDLVISQPKRFDLFLGEVVRTDAWNLVHSELLRRLPARMSADDHVILVDHDRNLESKFLNGLGHLSDGGVVLPWVVLIRFQVGDLDIFDLHSFPFGHNKSTGCLPDAFFSLSYDYLLIFGVLVFLVLRLRRGDIVRHRER